MSFFTSSKKNQVLQQNNPHKLPVTEADSSANTNDQSVSVRASVMETITKSTFSEYVRAQCAYYMLNFICAKSCSYKIILEMYRVGKILSHL